MIALTREQDHALEQVSLDHGGCSIRVDHGKAGDAGNGAVTLTFRCGCHSGEQHRRLLEDGTCRYSDMCIVCGHEKDQHSPRREDDYACDVDGCDCNGFMDEPPDGYLERVPYEGTRPGSEWDRHEPGAYGSGGGR
jgi:hypothetical protein